MAGSEDRTRLGQAPKLKDSTGNIDRDKIGRVVALAGNSNVGKSAIFNQLTGVDQIIGNWPGKTVERAEGLLQYKGQRIKIIDLPGIYSFSTYSMEEIVSRDFIALEKPDAVVNVVDASALERNLFFTLQLIELEVPMVMALNQVDLMEKKGLSIDARKLEEILGMPVVTTVAIKGKGIADLTEKIINITERRTLPHRVQYGREIEERVEKLVAAMCKMSFGYPARWTAIKLLEQDQEIVALVEKSSPEISRLAKTLGDEIEQIHGEPSSIVITGERYHVADMIAHQVLMELKAGVQKRSMTDWLDGIALHPVLGYLVAIAVIGGLLVWTFVIGAQISTFIQNVLTSFEQYEPVISGPIGSIIWNGAYTGFVAGVTLIIPYVLPFYLLLAFIEDSGYLTRIAVILDRGMHKLGLHGKAIIPLILGYGCNVPAIYSCRIMESPKQKKLLAFLVTFVPCTARTVVILGLVAAFVNIWWAFALYAFDILLIIVVGRIAFKVMPGESVGLIMEMADYHVPSLKVILKQTWARTKSLILIVFPTYIVGSAALQALYAYGVLNPINAALTPITVWWLGLPAVAGILLIFGIVRKEMTILTLAVIFQTTNFASIMSPVQLIVLALVSMIYIPCLSTIFAIASEFSWKDALIMTLVEIGLAIAIGGIAFRLLTLFI
ncbi:MAG TPA: ferrous iron transport protein B [Methanocella sp.]|uniref:ferrous iron transport protein B n=1 Tax=Methanocella sp. TaxID=2052833 RepID=UPI002C366613|nr:ferrous iron transport protein B [Methanocella sp.]HTY92118.1 ferrous iron transport protein B [Methanocella sp.]